MKSRISHSCSSNLLSYGYPHVHVPKSIASSVSAWTPIIKLKLFKIYRPPIIRLSLDSKIYQMDTQQPLRTRRRTRNRKKKNQNGDELEVLLESRNLIKDVPTPYGRLVPVGYNYDDYCGSQRTEASEGLRLDGSSRAACSGLISLPSSNGTVDPHPSGEHADTGHRYPLRNRSRQYIAPESVETTLSESCITAQNGGSSIVTGGHLLPPMRDMRRQLGDIPNHLWWNEEAAQMVSHPVAAEQIEVPPGRDPLHVNLLNGQLCSPPQSLRAHHLVRSDPWSTESQIAAKC